MKHFLCIMLAVLFVIALTACNSSSDTNNSSTFSRVDNLDFVFDERDQFKFQKNMLLTVDGEQTTKLVTFYPSMIRDNTPSNVMFATGEYGAVNLEDYSISRDGGISTAVIVEYKDGYRVVFNNENYEIQKKNKKSTNTLEVWDIYPGESLLEHPDSVLSDKKQLYFSARKAIQKVEDGTSHKGAHSRASGTVPNADGDDIYFLINDICWDVKEFQTTHKFPVFTGDFVVDMMDVAVETLRHNYDCIVEALEGCGFNTTGTTMKSKDVAEATIRENPENIYINNGYLCLDLSTDTTQGYFTIHITLSEDAKHVLMVAASDGKI